MINTQVCVRRSSLRGNCYKLLTKQKIDLCKLSFSKIKSFTLFVLFGVCKIDSFEDSSCVLRTPSPSFYFLPLPTKIHIHLTLSYLNLNEKRFPNETSKKLLDMD